MYVCVYYLYIKKSICLNVIRVCPKCCYAVSRSFGDRDLKAEGLISCTPEVVLVPLTPSLRFILLACDGVWDALSDQVKWPFAQKLTQMTTTVCLDTDKV